MTFYYITNSKLPTEKAFGYGISKMCEAFGGLNADVVLVVPKRHGVMPETLFKYYGVKKQFTIKTLWSLDLFRYERFIGKLAYAIQAMTFFFLLLWLPVKRDDILYSRDLFILPWLRLRSKRVFLEIHFLQATQKRLRGLFRFAGKIITTTAHLKDEIAAFGIPPERILVAHDAVDLPLFGITLAKTEARARLELPQDKIILGYTGNFKAMGMDKGIANMLYALPKLRQRFPNILFIAVGGVEPDISEYERMAQDCGVADIVRLLPRVKVTDLPVYQQACDILTMTPPRNEYFSYHVSPLKMFEYMAGNRPIVAADLPGIREVLNERNAVLVDADDTQKLASVIDALLRDGKRCQEIAAQARADVEKFTWEKRAEGILRNLSL